MKLIARTTLLNMSYNCSWCYEGLFYTTNASSSDVNSYGLTVGCGFVRCGYFIHVFTKMTPL